MLSAKISVEDQGFKLRVAGCFIVNASVGYFCVTSGVRLGPGLVLGPALVLGLGCSLRIVVRVRTFSSTGVRFWVRLGLRLRLRLCKG